MRKDWSAVEPGRVKRGHIGTMTGERQGAFMLRVNGADIICIVDGVGCPEIPWEHVSARARDRMGERMPNWTEMQMLKELFWEDEECVVQFHPPKSEYVNNHPHVLHLWRPLNLQMPRPPASAVGIPTSEG